MFHEFPTTEIDTGETTIFVRSSGSGPPLLLLHGFPETHLMWRDIAPLLAQDFTVVCVDLSGYGRSGCPPSSSDLICGMNLRVAHSICGDNWQSMFGGMLLKVATSSPKNYRRKLLKS
jgi:pimeloyl-ACP methyl ester carboxylesterase